MILFFSFSFKGTSQTPINTNQNVGTTINAAGSNAIGSSGTVAYSIGQVFYTYIGIDDSVYNVAQGIQHGQSYQTLDTPNVVEFKTEISIYPNPVTDFVNLNMEGFEHEDGTRSYVLYDYQGRLLKQNIINQNETQIDLNNLSPSVYLLQVKVNEKALKTFKIIKK
jgi:hypothetical protein